MKAIRIHSYGHSDQLKLEDAPRPEIGEGEVLVRVRAAGVNPADWKIREGFLKAYFPQSFPSTPGQDVAGEIEAVGRGVTTFRPGDEVFGMASGAYAEFAKARPEGLAKKPRSLGFEEAAAVPVAGLMAWQALDAAGVEEGQRILIHGAAGGVGSFAVQLAKHRGARVAATAAAYDISYLKSLGVEPIIDFQKERFEDRVGQVDAVIDLIGGETLKRSYGVVKEGGAIVTTLGEVDKEEAGRRKLRAEAIFVKADSGQLSQLAQLIDQGVVKPRVAQVLPLDQAARAQDLNQQHKAHGKVVLHVA